MAAAKDVRAHDKPGVGVDCFARANQFVPPADTEVAFALRQLVSDR